MVGNADWPPFPFQIRADRAWRERVLTRAAESRSLLEWFRSGDDIPPPDDHPLPTAQLDRSITLHLNEAVDAAKNYRLRRPTRRVATVERATSNLDAAEVGLLRRAPEYYLCGQFSHILAHVRLHLPKNDPRRVRVEDLQAAAEAGTLGPAARESIARAVWAASLESRKEIVRVWSFCGVLLASAFMLTLIAVGVGWWGALWPHHVELCFGTGTTRVCPIGDAPDPSDVFLVEFIGLLSGALSGATALHNIGAGSPRLGMLAILALVKLPTGALTAYLGILLVTGGFVPGLSRLDSSAQILAWAVVFGAAQQLVTGMVDRRAHDVLSQVSGKTNKYIE